MCKENVVQILNDFSVFITFHSIFVVKTVFHIHYINFGQVSDFRSLVLGKGGKCKDLLARMNAETGCFRDLSTCLHEIRRSEHSSSQSIGHEKILETLNGLSLTPITIYCKNHLLHAVSTSSVYFTKRDYHRPLVSFKSSFMLYCVSM